MRYKVPGSEKHQELCKRVLEDYVCEKPRTHTDSKAAKAEKQLALKKRFRAELKLDQTETPEYVKEQVFFLC